MLNVSFSINDKNETHQVFFEQDAAVPSTINSLIDGSPHAMTGMSATPNGYSVKGQTQIWFWKDDVAIMVSPSAVGSSTVTIVVSGWKTFSGVVSKEETAAIASFFVSCHLPPMAE